MNYKYTSTIRYTHAPKFSQLLQISYTDCDSTRRVLKVTPRKSERDR